VNLTVIAHERRHHADADRADRARRAGRDQPGLAAIIGIEAFTRLPLILVAQRMFTGIDSFPLMAVPLFILAGNLMAAGGISKPAWSTSPARWSAACRAGSPRPASSPA
jgi:hypothetical protein